VIKKTLADLKREHALGRRESHTTQYFKRCIKFENVCEKGHYNLPKARRQFPCLVTHFKVLNYRLQL
jgi:hypothetical protein